MIIIKLAVNVRGRAIREQVVSKSEKVVSSVNFRSWLIKNIVGMEELKEESGQTGSIEIFLNMPLALAFLKI